jgi:leucyl/phenylalanyl-tRNA--protein transferase
MYYLSKDLYFPPVESSSPEGIVAVGGDLSIPRLLLAYENGIFPWYDAEDPIIWWSPPKRMVVFPDKYKVSKSMRNILNQNKFTITVNTCFSRVIKNCQKTVRKDQNGTWITTDIIRAYTRLHDLGIAKSVEVWQRNTNGELELVGGLYGLDFGTVFCGESMFSKVSNASKVAFISLIEHLKKEKYDLLDCQIHNDHLEKLGALEIPREEFLAILKK